jgi:ribulose kinase
MAHEGETSADPQSRSLGMGKIRNAVIPGFVASAGQTLTAVGQRNNWTLKQSSACRENRKKAEKKTQKDIRNGKNQFRRDYRGKLSNNHNRIER